MPAFTFECTDAHPDTSAAAPTISLRLHITETTGETVHALALRTQIRIEPLRRRYEDTEADAMRDLFGERARWGTTLKPLQFGFVNQMVPTFTGEATVEVAMPCSYDFDVAANKYLYALADGEIPLLLLFSGTVFTAAGNGFSVSLVPWDREARYRLPVSVWKQTMELHFPGTAWLRLGRASFDALHRYRTQQQLTSWDDAIDRLLKEAEQ
jgi:hypothetical protein